MKSGAGRLIAGFADQGVSSASNLIFVFAMARLSGVDEFGSFSVAYAFFAFGLAVQRAFLGTLVSLTPDRVDRATLAIPVGWGLAVAAGGLGTLAALDSASAPSTLFLISSAWVYLQDVWRYRRIAEGNPFRALMSDGLWFLAAAVVFGLVVVGAVVEGLVVVAVWSVLGAGTALLVIVARGSLKFTDTSERLIDPRDVTTLLPDAVLSQIVPVLLASIVAASLSLEDVAAQRGAGTLMAPVSLLLAALPVVVLPLMARMPTAARRRSSAVQSALMLAIIAGWGGLLLALPAAVGEFVLGDVWEPSRTLVLLVVVEMAFWGVVVGYDSYLRSHRMWGLLLGIRVGYAVVALGLLAFTVRTGDISVVLMGMICAAAFILLLHVLVSRKLRGSAAHMGASPAEGVA